MPNSGRSSKCIVGVKGCEKPGLLDRAIHTDAALHRCCATLRQQSELPHWEQGRMDIAFRQKPASPTDR